MQKIQGSTLTSLLGVLSTSQHLLELKKITRGLEKESLRVTNTGRLSITGHPKALGSALKNPLVTTDFSEALVEIITPPQTNIDETLNTLHQLHSWVYQNIDDELLWANSMPCAFGDDSDIPIAQYGESHIGKMKEVYRAGLDSRYGRKMQTIAGLHYNWSLPDECLQILHSESQATESFHDFKIEAYFGLMRNFRRHTWMLLYLFGATPAIDQSLLNHKEHKLTVMDDGETLYGPYATSLRMSDLGYQSPAQNSFQLSYTNIHEYTSALRAAITMPFSDYEKFGIKDKHGEYAQLNTGLLQIENEFYSAIRPKCVARSGEAPLNALLDRGVEYIEVRCIDLNPCTPLGIDREQIYFLDVFLLYCLLADSPDIDAKEEQAITQNDSSTAYEGRNPKLMLSKNQQAISLKTWGEALLLEMLPIAQLLDTAHTTKDFSNALTSMQNRFLNSALTPSAEIINQLTQGSTSLQQWSLEKSAAHKGGFSNNNLNKSTAATFARIAEKSWEDKQSTEANDSGTFTQWLSNYYSQYK